MERFKYLPNILLLNPMSCGYCELGKRFISVLFAFVYLHNFVASRLHKSVITLSGNRINLKINPH